MYLAAQIESKNKLGKEDKFFGMTNEEILYNKATLKQMGFLKWFWGYWKWSSNNLNFL